MIEETDEKIERYARLLAELRSRGGDLWFVHTPSSGAQREYEEKYFPRERYWDLLLERTGAIGIHFEDLDYEQALYCPDEDHLDSASSEAFTRAVAKEIRRRTEYGRTPTVRESAKK